MAPTLSFERLRSILIAGLRQLPDHRTRPNRHYEMVDTALGAFAVFYMQAPSFLAHQRDMQRSKGRNNAQSLFGVEQVPSDPQIRNLLDPVAPQHLGGVFWTIWQQLRLGGYLTAYQGSLTPWLCGLDGTQYFHSTKIHCDQCTERVLNGQPHYAHSLVAPVLVAPGRNQIIALEPEFIRPQDGVEKQDCELQAAQRWLGRNLHHFTPGSLTLLGDDLYCHNPFCELLRSHQCHFIFTCKPDSHPALYEELALLTNIAGVSTWTERCWTGRGHEIWQYRYVNQVPLRAERPTLYVNWCEVTITAEATGAELYHNAWATDHALTEPGLRRFVTTARTRWKNENENNNVLKNYGYHLEHNFGHGHQYLAMLLVLLNLLAFLFHTALELCDELYRRVRTELATRMTFFHDIRALTRYLYFDSWQALLVFMATQLELDVGTT